MSVFNTRVKLIKFLIGLLLELDISERSLKTCIRGRIVYTGCVFISSHAQLNA